MSAAKLLAKPLFASRGPARGDPNHECSGEPESVSSRTVQCRGHRPGTDTARLASSHAQASRGSARRHTSLPSARVSHCERC
jgi:hypothetical protein